MPFILIFWYIVRRYWQDIGKQSIKTWQKLLNCGANMKEFLKDDDITLMRFSERFVTPEYMEWLNDHNVTKYLCVGRMPISEDEAREFKNDNNNIRFSIVFNSEGTSFWPIGTISLNNIDWISRKCDVGYMIGESDCWGKGIATKAINLAIDYAFNRLGLNKITAGVVEGNIGSKRSLEKNGFTEYGVNPQDYYLDGELLGTHLFYKLRCEHNNV